VESLRLTDTDVHLNLLEVFGDPIHATIREICRVLHASSSFPDDLAVDLADDLAVDVSRLLAWYLRVAFVNPNERVRRDRAWLMGVGLNTAVISAVSAPVYKPASPLLLDVYANAMAELSEYILSLGGGEHLSEQTDDTDYILRVALDILYRRNAAITDKTTIPSRYIEIFRAAFARGASVYAASYKTPGGNADPYPRDTSLCREALRCLGGASAAKSSVREPANHDGAEAPGTCLEAVLMLAAGTLTRLSVQGGHVDEQIVVACLDAIANPASAHQLPTDQRLLVAIVCTVAADELETPTPEQRRELIEPTEMAVSAVCRGPDFEDCRKCSDIMQWLLKRAHHVLPGDGSHLAVLCGIFMSCVSGLADHADHNIRCDALAAPATAPTIATAGDSAFSDCDALTTLREKALAFRVALKTPQRDGVLDVLSGLSEVLDASDDASALAVAFRAQRLAARAAHIDGEAASILTVCVSAAFKVINNHLKKTKGGQGVDLKSVIREVWLVLCRAVPFVQTCEWTPWHTHVFAVLDRLYGGVDGAPGSGQLRSAIRANFQNCAFGNTPEGMFDQLIKELLAADGSCASVFFGKFAMATAIARTRSAMDREAFEKTLSSVVTQKVENSGTIHQNTRDAILRMHSSVKPTLTHDGKGVH